MILLGSKRRWTHKAHLDRATVQSIRSKVGQSMRNQPDRQRFLEQQAKDRSKNKEGELTHTRSTSKHWNSRHRRREKEKQVQHIRVEQVISWNETRGEWHTSRGNTGELKEKEGDIITRWEGLVGSRQIFYQLELNVVRWMNLLFPTISTKLVCC